MTIQSCCVIWWCSAFVPPEHDGPEDAAPEADVESGDFRINPSDNYYKVLGLKKNASIDDVKKAYKKRSLMMHPDKLAQRGKTLTDADRKAFLRIKESYDVLVDPKSRSLYDALGERLYKWSLDPMSIDRMEVWRNFCRSSVLARFKIFSLFLLLAAFAVAPAVVFCVRTDGGLSQAPWSLVLVPLWLVDALFLSLRLYHVSMPSATPPPEDDGTWKDPYPRKERLHALAVTVMWTAAEVMCSIRADDYVSYAYCFILIPVLLIEADRFVGYYKSIFLRFMSYEEFEATAAHNNLTPEQSDELRKRYKLLPSDSMEFMSLSVERSEALTAVFWLIGRVIVEILSALHLDGNVNFSWWAAFAPMFALSCCCCSCALRNTFGSQQELAALDDYEALRSNQANYGTLPEGMPDLSPEQLLHRRTVLQELASRNLWQCVLSVVTGAFFALTVARFAGATFSSIWIIFPALLVIGCLLCCIGFAIFTASEEAMAEAMAQQNGGGAHTDEESAQQANASAANNSVEGRQGMQTDKWPGNSSKRQAEPEKEIVIAAPPAPAARADATEKTALLGPQGKSPAVGGAEAETTAKNEKNPDEMTAKELKAAIDAEGLSAQAAGFSEKHEFVNLLKSHYLNKGVTKTEDIGVQFGDID